MDFYYHIAWILIFWESLFFFQMALNYRYARMRIDRARQAFRPRTVLIVPCKGIDATFEANITSFYFQDFENYILWFVVADTDDPAYEHLCKIREKLTASMRAREVEIFVAGKTNGCSQKIHNLLYCYNRLGDDVEVMAFVDSDACLRDNWLKHIVHPLQKDKVGVATGYRWFVPQRNNLATLALSSINAKVAQLMGGYRFHQAWGGSMAIRVKLFRELGIDKAWSNSVSDDLVLSYLVKKAHKKIAFVPACLVASYEQTTWRALFEFGRRQFIITRVVVPSTWWIGLIGSLISNFGFIGGLGLAIYAAIIKSPDFWLFAAVPAVVFIDYMLLAAIRQNLIARLLPQDVSALKAAKWADILGNCFFSLVLLGIIISSAVGRRITWRGIVYRLAGPTQTEIESMPAGRDQAAGSPTR